MLENVHISLPFLVVRIVEFHGLTLVILTGKINETID